MIYNAAVIPHRFAQFHSNPVLQNFLSPPWTYLEVVL